MFSKKIRLRMQDSLKFKQSALLLRDHHNERFIEFVLLNRNKMQKEETSSKDYTILFSSRKLMVKTTTILHSTH